MRLGKRNKLCWEKALPLLRPGVPGSKVTPSSAAEIARCDTPCAAASFLKAASQTSKLPVLRQRGAASVGTHSAVAATRPSPAIAAHRVFITEPPNNPGSLCHPAGYRQVAVRND